MSETYGVDTEYDANLTSITAHYCESLTASLYNYLKHKGITVHKAEAPVIMYEGDTVQMMTRKVLIDCPMIETFEQIYQHLVDNNIDEIFLYQFNQQYIYAQQVGAAYEPVGEPVLREYRNIRYGVREK